MRATGPGGTRPRLDPRLFGPDPPTFGGRSSPRRIRTTDFDSEKPGRTWISREWLYSGRAEWTGSSVVGGLGRIHRNLPDPAGLPSSSCMPPAPRYIPPPGLSFHEGPGMDAANPLCRWLWAALLAALIGCHAGHRMPLRLSRGSAGPPPRSPPAGPLAPVSPSGQASPNSPSSPPRPRRTKRGGRGSSGLARRS